MAENKKEGTLINCFFCRYFYLTDQVKAPYGCRAHGFTTFRMPSVDVYEASEEDCALFIRKEPDEHTHDK
jgi:hypothetical protein